MVRTDDTLQPEDSPIARGIRLKKARTMTVLSSEQLADALGYSRQTISYWENGANGGLSQKGAVKVVNLLKQHGIQCDIGWLLYGIGDITLFKANQTVQKSTLENRVPPSVRLSPEITLFLQTYPDAVVTQVEDASMQPLFYSEDWVGGCLLPVDARWIGQPCLVQYKDHYVVGLLAAGTTAEKYTLVLPNNPTDAFPPFFELTDVLLTEVAPVIRVWKKPFSL